MAFALLVLATLGTLAPRAAAQDAPAAGEPGGKPAREVIIVHTADLHGQVVPLRDPASGEATGGIEALALAIEAARSEARSRGAGFLYLDAGDFWQGGPESDRTGGALMTAWLGLVGLDALALGEHDFDAGAEALPALLAGTRFPALAANLCELDSGQPPAYARPACDLDAGGVRVAVIGIIDERAKELSAPRAFRGLDVRAAHEVVAREVVGARRRGAEVVVLLSHAGLAADRDLAAHIPGIDLVLGARADAEVREIDLATGTLIHAVASKGAALGRVELRLEEGRLARKHASALRVAAAPGQRHEATAALVERVAGPLVAEMDEVVGVAPAALVRGRGFGSSALGNWTADLLREKAGADLALTNKAGLAADLAAGAIRVRDLYAVSPYANDLVTLTLRGAEVRAELEWALSDPRFALEVSGLEVRYDPDRPVGERLVQALIGGAPLEPERLYKVATNSFLGKGGHGHRWLAAERDWKRHPDVRVLDLQLASVRSAGRLAPPAEPRVAPAATTMPRME